MMKSKQKKEKTKDKKKNRQQKKAASETTGDTKTNPGKQHKSVNSTDMKESKHLTNMKKHKQLTKEKAGNGTSTLSRQDSSGGDEYGFLDKTRLRRAPRVSVAAQAVTVPEIDYLEDNMLNRSYRSVVESISSNDNIPITLGSISSTGSYRDSIPWPGMPMNIPPSPGLLTDENYVTLNTPTPRSKCSDIYKEREEQRETHYALLNAVRKEQTRGRDEDSLNDTLNFYPRKAAEHRARSRSRTNTQQFRSSSAGAELRSYLPQRNSSARHRSPSRSRARSQSRTRDIVELYTNNSRGRARERSPSTHRSISTASPATLTGQSSYRSASVVSRLSRSRDPVVSVNNMYSRSKSESRCSSVSRDALSMCSNMTTQSRALSTSEIAAENLQLWMTTTSKNQSSPTKKSPKSDENFNFVTLLEMDTQKNNQIEKELSNANSVKPASVKMMMIAGHTPNKNWESKDEVCVKPGAIVTGIYKQNEWLFIMTENREVGFVPYAYTKPIKVTPISVNGKQPKKSPAVKLQNNTAQDASAKNITGILKTSKHNKQKSTYKRPVQPKYSVKVRTTDSDSISSENSSVFLENFVYTRPSPTNTSTPHADCIVTDDALYVPAHEDMGTYCSDSGISEPTSNHSDEAELASPTGLPPKQFPPNAAGASSSRLLNERVVSVTIHRLASSPAQQTSSGRERQKHYDTTTHINNMPLGPLGQRLARQAEQKPLQQEPLQQKPNKKIANDTRERARCSSETPASMRPTIPKDYTGPRVTVVYDYEPENEDDLQVRASDIVTLLNGEDTEWIWVQRKDGLEGFIPKKYVIPIILNSHSMTHSRRTTGIVAL